MRAAVFVAAIAFLLVSVPAGAARTVEISAYFGNNLALRNDGTVSSWGDNTAAQLGDGTTLQRSSPVRVANLANIVAVAAANDTSLALDSTGHVWAWGDNRFGYLGIERLESYQLIPALVPSLSNVIAIANTGAYRLALRSDGTVWAWGFGGTLGDGTTEGRSIPVRVVGLTNVVAISASQTHAVAVTGDGRVWAWGSNRGGALGLSSATTSSLVPVEVPGIANVKQVAADYQGDGLGGYTLAITSDNAVWSWGTNANGQLGDGTTTGRFTPARIQGLNNVARVSTRWGTSFAVRNDGQVWWWGGVAFTQYFGPGSATPAPAVITSEPIVAVAAGGTYALALTASGRVLARGSNTRGELGLADTIVSPTTTTVPALTSVVSVAANYYQSVALRNDGSVWSWGEPGGAFPQRVTGFTQPVRAVSGGNLGYFVGLQADGRVYGWGGSVPGLNGGYFSNATLIPAFSNVTSVAAGYFGIIALTNAGRAQMACLPPAPDIVDSCEVTATDFGFADVIAVAAGSGCSCTIGSPGNPLRFGHFLVLRRDGSVWALGANDFGQLGDGTTINAPATPVRVAGLSNIKQIYAGDAYSVAVAEDGAVYLWGLPPDVGLEDTRRSFIRDPGMLTPTRVAELAGAAIVAVGEHLLAIDGAGRAFAWGRGPKVGVRDRLVPGRMPEADGMTSLAAGRFHTLAVTADGRVVAWGRNTFEQLGVSRTKSSAAWQPIRDPASDVETKSAVSVVEFFNANVGAAGDPTGMRGHHFITGFADEALALEAGTNAKGWQRSGRTWRAWIDATTAPSSAKPVYRFFSSRWNSHFYTAVEKEKDDLLNKNPTQDPAIDWKLETVAFFITPPSASCPSLSVSPRSDLLCTSGQPPSVADCPPGHYPVYRAHNIGPGSTRGDPNHRFTSNWIDVYRNVRFSGYVYEGVAFCSPASSQPGGDLHAFNTYPADDVGAGEPLTADYWFSNAGPGSADGTTIIAVLPDAVSWTIQCFAYHGAQCPSSLAAMELRTGVRVPALPPGGVLRLAASGAAPGQPGALSFTSSIGPPGGAPDSYGLNNAAPVSQTVVKAASVCSLTVAPGAIGSPASGTSASARIDVPAGCTWNVVSDEAWVSLLPVGGTGAGTLEVTTRENGPADRTATLTITTNAATVQLPVRQRAAVLSSTSAPCQGVKLSRNADQVGGNRTSLFVGVQAPTTDCTWTARSDHEWIVISAPPDSRGSAQVEYTVLANPGSEPRMGILNIQHANGVQVLTVFQDGGHSSTSAESGGAGDTGGDGGSGSGGAAGG